MSGYPLFVKPANLGSSVGVSKCRNRSSLYEGLMDAARYDRRVLVERGLEARELEVSVLGNDGPAGLGGGRGDPGRRVLFVPGEVSGRHLGAADPGAARAGRLGRSPALGSRVLQGDRRRRHGTRRLPAQERSTGKLYINEINTLPGFTSISMYPKLWLATGYTYPGLIDRLIELALERQAEKDALLRVYGGAG